MPALTDLAAIGQLLVDSSGRLIVVIVAPGGGDRLYEGGLTELIGVDERVDQNEYGGSVGVALPATSSGVIYDVTLYTTEDGTGAILTPNGVLYIFDADPTIAVGDAAMTAAERVTVVGQIRVASSDWIADANGASACMYWQPIPFHSLANLYFAWFHLDAVSFNDGAGDDEQLEFNFWVRRFD